MYSDEEGTFFHLVLQFRVKLCNKTETVPQLQKSAAHDKLLYGCRRFKASVEVQCWCEFYFSAPVTCRSRMYCLRFGDDLIGKLHTFRISLSTPYSTTLYQVILLRRPHNRHVGTYNDRKLKNATAAWTLEICCLYKVPWKFISSSVIWGDGYKRTHRSA